MSKLHFVPSIQKSCQFNRVGGNSPLVSSPATTLTRAPPPPSLTLLSVINPLLHLKTRSAHVARNGCPFPSLHLLFHAFNASEGQILSPQPVLLAAQREYSPALAFYWPNRGNILPPGRSRLGELADHSPTPAFYWPNVRNIPPPQRSIGRTSGTFSPSYPASTSSTSTRSSLVTFSSILK